MCQCLVILKVTHFTRNLRSSEEHRIRQLCVQILLPVCVCEILLLQIISNQFNSLPLANFQAALVTTPEQLWVWLWNYHWSCAQIHTDKHPWESAAHRAGQIC